jgi:CysZ protein
MKDSSLLTARLGFLDGVKSVGRAVAWLIATPRVWLWAMWPVLMWFLLSAFALYSAVEWVLDWARAWLNGFGGVTGRVLPWLVTGAAAVVGLFLAWMLASPFSAPALEKIVRERERALGVPAREDVSFFTGLLLGIKVQLTWVLVVTPGLFVLWLLGLLMPPLMVVTYPLKILIVVCGMAFTLFDYPLTLRGMTVRDRWRLMRDNAAPVLGFGVVFTVLFWVPFAPILLLPAAAAAAAELCARMSRTLPSG